MALLIYDRTVKGSIIQYLPFDAACFRAAKEVLSKDDRFTYREDFCAYQQGSDLTQFIDNTIIQVASSLLKDSSIRNMIRASGARYYMHSHDSTKRPIEELFADASLADDALLYDMQRQDHQDRG